MKTLESFCRQFQNRNVQSQLTKMTLAFALLFLIIASHAQVFYGTTSGGDYGVGSIFKVNGDGSGFKESHLQASNGNNNDAYRTDVNRHGLTQFSNGKFYGATMSGGASWEGVLFEYDPMTKQYNEKIDFYFYSSDISTSPMLEYNGKLYGTSTGLSHCIYSYNPVTNFYKEEYRLPSRSPGLIQQDGKFYGMTNAGGLKKVGAIFEYDPKTDEYTVLFQFDKISTGNYPEGGLTYHDGKLYGVTTSGGLYAQGTLFEYELSTHIFEKKIDFKADVTGSGPIGDLSFFNNRLLGMTSGGGNHNQGVLYEFDLSTELLHKAVDFSPELPGGIVKLLNGKLFGVSTEAGANGTGVLFSFDPESHEYNKLFEFNEDENGTFPFGELAVYDNTLIGMTRSGGKGGGGVLFEYDITSDHLQVQNSFNYSPFGKKPVALIEAGTAFYGITTEGGATGNGALFELNPETFALTNLHDFSCAQCDGGYQGQGIEGKLLTDNNTIYGIVTKGKHIDDGGELFAYDIVQKNYSTLVEFNSDETGVDPIGNIAIANGKIVGTTRQGGSENSGVLFEYDIVHATFQIVKSLDHATTGLDLRFTSRILFTD